MDKTHDNGDDDGHQEVKPVFPSDSDHLVTSSSESSFEPRDVIEPVSV